MVSMYNRDIEIILFIYVYIEFDSFGGYGEYGWVMIDKNDVVGG